MDTAYSYNFGKFYIREWIRRNFRRDAKILDVGAGCGTYYWLLHIFFPNMDAVEIYKPNIENYKLEKKYRKVYNCDILGLEYDSYDLIIFGDIIEHLSVDDAETVLGYAINKCNNLIVSVPYCLESKPNENPYEEHIQSDLTQAKMKERYPYLKLLFGNSKYGYYIKQESKND